MISNRIKPPAETIVSGRVYLFLVCNETDLVAEKAESHSKYLLVGRWMDNLTRHYGGAI